jgi:MFS family permease
VIIVCKLNLTPAQFDNWGWRIPFLASALLLGISVWIRLKLAESPVFQKMKAEGKHSKAPISESFGNWKNLKIVLLALLGLTAGQGVVWYTGQFYAMFFLSQTLKVDLMPAQLMIAVSLVLGTPFFIVFGTLSDRIGRKKIIMAGCVLAALTYFPLFKGLTHFANPGLEAAVSSSPVVVVAAPGDCSFQFDPVGRTKFTSTCDIAKSSLAKRGVPYANEDAPAGTAAVVKVGSTVVASYDGSAPDAKVKGPAFDKALAAALTAAKYPAKADPAAINYPMVVLLLFILVLYVTMVYGPIAAALVEFFPTRIRYTSMSLPYHIGNGWFGGLLPATAFAIVAAKGDIYAGLWYPIVVATMTAVIGSLFVRETKQVDIRAEV